MNSSFPCPIGIQSQLKIPLCLPCKVMLWNERSAKRHLRNDVHKMEKQVVDEIVGVAFEKCSSEMGDASVKMLRGLYEAAPMMPRSTRPCDPLPFLSGVRIENGYGCEQCLFFVKSIASLSDHAKLTHSLDEKQAEAVTARIMQRGSVFIQTLQLGNRRKYFRVLKNSSQAVEDQIREEVDTDAVAEVEVFKRLFILEGEESNGETDGLTHECRQKSDFVDRTKADKILFKGGLSFSEAVWLSATTLHAGALTEDEKRVLRHSYIYLSCIPPIVDEMSPSLLQKISLKSGHAFQNITEESRKAYGTVAGRLLLSAARHVRAHKLEPASFPAIISYMKIWKETDVCDADILKAMHESFKEICLVRNSELKGVETLFLRNFIACCSVRRESGRNGESFRFCEADEVSPIVAALQYLVSSVAAFDIKLIATTEAETPGSMLLYGSNSQAPSETTVLEKLDINANTGAGYVRYVLNICSALLRHRTTDVCFSPCSRHDLCGFINGVELSMEDQGRFLRRWQQDIEDIMMKELLFGSEYPKGILDYIALLPDKISERKLGFSFLKHPQTDQKVSWFAGCLLQILKRNASGANKIFTEHLPQDQSPGYTLDLGDFSLLRSGVEAWLRSVQKVQELILCCIHVSSGSPARATEVATYRLENSVFGQRNIYCSQGDVFILCRYSKQRKTRGYDRPILRVPDQKTASLLKLYLVLFRRTEAKFVSLLAGSENGKKHLEYLSVERGIPYPPSKVRDVIRQKFVSENKDIGIADYRNHSAAMVRMIARRCATMADQLVDDYETAGHEQAGHSSSTANKVYGRSNRDFPGLGAGDVEKYRAWATEYHAALFKWEDKITMETVLEKDGGRAVETARSSDLNEFCNRIDGIANEINETVRSTYQVFHNLLKRSADDTYMIEPDSGGGSKRFKAAGLPENGCIVSDRKRRSREKDAHVILPALKKLLGDRTASFRSQMQADVVADVLDCKDDLLVVMGTGEGKTMCVLLPVFLEGPSKTTIIVVPLIALGEEMLKRCAKLGITAGLWRRGEAARTQVIVCVAEYVARDEFITFLRVGVNEGRIVRLVVDEAHLTVLWEDFRPSLFNLRHMLNGTAKPIQRVLLSATVPVRERVRVLAAHGMKQALVRSSSTVRLNLKIKVWNVECSKTSSNFTLTMAAKLFQKLKIDPCIATRIMIFVMGRSDVDEIFSLFTDAVVAKRKGILLRYHAGMSRAERVTMHNMWQDADKKFAGKVCIMIATSAFGAGVDVPNVREVYHIGGAASIVQYAQEIGRAGRDQKLSHAVLLYSSQFARRREAFLRHRIEGDSSFEQMEPERRKLIDWTEFMKWASDETSCRKRALYELIDDVSPGLCLHQTSSANCDVCDRIAPFEEEGQVVENMPSKESKSDAECVTNGSEGINDDVDYVNKNSRVAGISGPETNTAGFGTAQDRGSNFHAANDGISRRNHLLNVEDHHGLTKIWSRYRALTRRLLHLCVPCLIFKGRESIEIDKNMCFECSTKDESKCFRCLAPDHSVGICPIPKWVSGHCSKCGLWSFPGVPKIHEKKKFGFTCESFATNKMFWMLWRSRDLRDEMLRDVMTFDEASAIRNKLEHEENVDSPEVLLYVHQWLHNKRGIPNHMRVLFWIGEKHNVC